MKRLKDLSLHRAGLAIMLVTTLATSFYTFGASEESAANTLSNSASVAAFDQQIRESQRSINTLTGKIAEQREKLAAVKEQSQPFLEEYIKARQHIKALKEQVDSDGSLQLASRYKNEELKFIMMESRYEEANDAITAEQELLTKLEKQLAWQQSKNKKLGQQKREVLAAIDQAQKAEAEKQKKAANEMAASNEAAQAELQQLRALLAKREQELVKARALIEDAEQKQATSAPVTTAVTATEKPAIEPTVSEQAVIPESAVDNAEPIATIAAVEELQTTPKIANEPIPDPGNVVALEPERKTDSLEDKNERVSIITDANQAKMALAAFTKKARSGSKTRSDKIVRVKNLTKNKSTTKVMAAKGNEQYRVKLRLRGGQNEFKVGRTVITAHLPENEELTHYVALLDNQHGNQKLVLIENRVLK